MLTTAALTASAVLPPAGAAPASTPDPAAQHSIRGGVSDQNFYFVMADRFNNGTKTNDDGGLGTDPMVSGFDPPTRKGFFNGGDLKGLQDQLDYIQGLGTNSLWLTPSFKNKAVQGDGTLRTVRPATTGTGSRTSPRSTPPLGHQRRVEDPHRCRTRPVA